MKLCTYDRSMCDTTCRSSRNYLNVRHSLKVQFASSFNQFDIKVPISNESSFPDGVIQGEIRAPNAC